MDKRNFLKLSLIGLGGIVSAPLVANDMVRRRLSDITNDGFRLPKLRYGYDSLSPFMDKNTLSRLYNQDHAEFTNRFNTELKRTGAIGKSVREILTNVSRYPHAVRLNGGGYFNYRLFWKVLSPGGSNEPSGDLRKAMIQHFNSIEEFKNQFSLAAGSVKGPGWTWLIVRNNRLRITTTSNQDNPVMNIAKDQGRPLLCLNMDEAAISRVHNGNRDVYINSFWNFVNWDFVAKKFSRVRNLS